MDNSSVPVELWKCVREQRIICLTTFMRLEEKHFASYTREAIYDSYHDIIGKGV